jgi:hypothetical protein
MICISLDSFRRVESVGDLGVLLTSNLSFTSHLNNVVIKSVGMLDFIRRTCVTFTSVSTLKSLYISYVRRQLEYCSIIWSPWQSTYVDNIERVQYTFLKYVCFKSSVPYSSSNCIPQTRVGGILWF